MGRVRRRSRFLQTRCTRPPGARQTIARHPPLISARLALPRSRSSVPAMTHWTLVTGANRGLGLELVRQLLADGARVVATCRRPGRAQALNALAAEYPGHLKVLPLDVGDAASREELAREWPLAAGREARIGLLVNNAGVLHGGERFGALTEEILDDSLRTNVVGPLLLTQALAPLLADGACVANLSSQLGSIAGTHGGSGRWWFALGACAASLVWFAGLGYGARLLAPRLASPRAWQVLDVLVGLVMVAIAVRLALGA